jgi:murein DD-endopeptidase MepM/ murein hydrolase activator NlpD
MRFPLLVLTASLVGLMSVHVSAKAVAPIKPAKTKAIVQQKKTTSDKSQPNEKVVKSIGTQVKPAPLVKQAEVLAPQADEAEFSPRLKQPAPQLPTDDQNDDLPAKHQLTQAEILVLQVQSILSESTSEEFEKIEPYVFIPADPNNLDLLWPVETRTISSAWGPRVRTAVTVVKTPNGKQRVRKPYNSVHRGVDLTAPLGHGIFAAMDGSVAAVGNNNKLGKFVRIDHGNGVETVYGHNSANLVQVGEMVRRGQIIAKVGSTGHSTGPHVHFEVLIDKQQVNPAPLLNDTEEISAEIIAYNENFQSSGRGR